MILGIDVGFSAKRKTSCYSALDIDDKSKVISFLHKPVKFGTGFNLQYIAKGMDIITVDASITPKLNYAQSGKKNRDAIFKRYLY